MTFSGGRFYFYKDSAFSGKAVEYFEDKKPKRERNFMKGLANGSEFIWYSNGRLKEEKNYLNGFFKQGVFKRWYENGNIRSSREYKNGLQIKFTTWYPEGMKKESVLIKMVKGVYVDEVV